MKPYHETKHGILYHADCLDVMREMADKSVDLCLTDPPYGMSYQSNYRSIKHDKIIGDDRFPIEVIAVFERVCTCASYVFCRWDNLFVLPKPKSFIAWVKNNWTAGDLLHEHGRMWEGIAFYPYTKHEFIKRIPDVLYSEKTLNELHPTQKPVNLLQSIISANICETILDPFAGSGTTAIACIRLNRRYILIEKEEKYCEIIAKRIDTELDQADIFREDK